MWKHSRDTRTLCDRKTEQLRTNSRTSRRKKFAIKESEEAVGTWSPRIELYHCTKRLGIWKKNSSKVRKGRDRERWKEQWKRQDRKRMDQQCELIKQLQFQKTLEVNQEMQQTQAKSTVMKLPKRSMTKFDGKFTTWLSFWNKFEAEIDSTALLPVTKFAYLKELRWTGTHLRRI